MSALQSLRDHPRLPGKAIPSLLEAAGFAVDVPKQTESRRRSRRPSCDPSRGASIRVSLAARLRWLLPSSAAQSPGIRRRTRLDDRSRIRSDRAGARQPLVPACGNGFQAGNAGDEGAQDGMPTFGRRGWRSHRSDPISRRTDCRERVSAPAAHRRFAQRQARTLSRPRARCARPAREAPAHAAAAPVRSTDTITANLNLITQSTWEGVYITSAQT